MIINENITEYIHSLEQDRSDVLEKLRQEAEKENVPVIRREMEPFIDILLNIHQPSDILEIGTGIGYSALFMNECLENARIVTIENYEPRLIKARKNLKGKENITLVEGDASEWVRTADTGFEMIFLDGAKAQYIIMLPDLIRLLNPGGILLADNILKDGELVKSRFAVPRRQRTIHTRMREFVWEIMHSPYLTSSVLTIGDGVTLSVKR